MAFLFRSAWFARVGRVVLTLLALALVFSALARPALAQVAATPPPSAAFPPVDISAEAAILVDITNGQVLYGSNIHERRAVASLTKIMTAVVALEYGVLSDAYVVRQEDLPGEASIGLEVGERLTLETLLYGMMMRSGNDAAMVVARGVGEVVAARQRLSAGGMATFVDLMNEKARALGMTNTQFLNPHGLDEAGHSSTAYDLALLTRHALAKQDFARIFGARSYPFRSGAWQNVNRMLDQYDGLIGGKTGVTDEAGLCLVEVARRGNLDLVAVVLDAPQWYNDARALFDYGYGPAQALPRSQLTRFGDASPGSGVIRSPAAVATPVVGSAATPASVVPTSRPTQLATATDAASPTVAPRQAFGASDEHVPSSKVAGAQVVDDGGGFTIVQLGLAVLAVIVLAAIAALWLRATGLGSGRRPGWTPGREETEAPWRTYDLSTRQRPAGSWNDEPDDDDNADASAEMDEIEPDRPARVERTGEMSIRDDEESATPPSPAAAPPVAANHDDDVAVAHLSVAARYVREGRLDAAESAFTKAIQVAPDFRFSREPLFWEMEAEGFVALAEAYLRSGRPSDARAVLALGQVVHRDHTSLQAMEERLQRERRRASGGGSR